MEGWNSTIGLSNLALPEWMAVLVADPGQIAWVLRVVGLVALIALVGWLRSSTCRRRERAARSAAAHEANTWRERYEREVVWRRASEASEAASGMHSDSSADHVPVAPRTQPPCPSTSSRSLAMAGLR